MVLAIFLEKRGMEEPQKAASLTEPDAMGV